MKIPYEKLYVVYNLFLTEKPLSVSTRKRDVPPLAQDEELMVYELKSNKRKAG